MNEQRNVFVCFFAFYSKQNKFVGAFFGRIKGAPKLLLVLSDLFCPNWLCSLKAKRQNNLVVISPNVKTNETEFIFATI